MTDIRCNGSAISEMQELKACPFCGGAATVENISTSLFTDRPLWMVGCFSRKCEVEAFIIDDRQEEAVRLWNTRTKPSQAGWQPIESAPKDGAPFIAYQNGEIYACRWLIDEPDEGPPAEGWFDTVNASFEAPTHWMPLPTAPLSQKPQDSRNPAGEE